MKKWNAGVQNEDLLNPVLYKPNHQMKSRWSSHSMMTRGRTGALSVSLKAALRVRGKALNEVSKEKIKTLSETMIHVFYCTNHNLRTVIK